MVRQAFIEELSSTSDRTAVGNGVGGEQDNMVTSSSSTMLLHHDGACSDDELVVSSSSTSSACEEEALHAMIDVLENDRPMMQMDSVGNGNHSGQENDLPIPLLPRGHSVEYWTVGGNNKRKNFIKKYPVSQVGNGVPAQMQPSNEMLFPGVGAAPQIQQQFNGYSYSPQIFQPGPQAEPFPVYQYNQNCVQAPVMAVQQPMQIFIPPGQQTGQFVPAQPYVQPHVTYYHQCYAQTSPRASESESEVSTELSTEQSQSGVEGQDSIKREADSTFVDGMNISSSSSLGSTQFSSSNGVVLDDSWHLPNFLVPSSPCSTVASSLSDTDLSGVLLGSQVKNGVVLDENGSVTSGYSTAPSTPTSRTLASEFNSETEVSGIDHQNLVPVADSLDLSMNQSGFGVDEMTYAQVQAQTHCSTVGTGMHDYEQYALQLRAINDARMGNILLQDIVTVPAANSQDYVYPGERVILLYSDAEGCGSVIMYNSEAVPYVANMFDLNVQSSLSLQSSGSKCFRYFVPPRTLDTDYFGGQMTMWQIKMVHYFLKFHPHTWKMHGVPETFDIATFLRNTMSIVGEFHIVSKLRFCCRACKTPWTSKKGTIVFKFCFNNATNRGWILMRIFGQICIKQDCADWTFQNPACYPEEIDRAVKKLSEYIGLHVYGIAVKPNTFADCFKSIRKSGGIGGSSKTSAGYPTPHKSQFCQACMNGVCKNLFIPALTSTCGPNQTSPSQIKEASKSSLSA
ncbi:Receptor-transporting protein 3 [Orchesella cincta]|uniref:Receptor-transporting protein 3 n=1 Tax=Orchesella cincta TaxID=48709 RepID=A0A1D2NH26_ORCCI|nr:Receptor-transporting protein 3 [Orchesella cincta]